MLTDRRRIIRQDVSFTDSVAWFSLSERLYPVHIVNRTPEGLGITIKQQPPVDPGQTVRIEWIKPTFVATDVVVRSILQIDIDEWYVGLEHAENASENRLSLMDAMTAY